MDMVRLRNGSEEPRVAVAATMMSLGSLWTKAPIVAFELVSLCRDAGHPLFGMAEERLMAAGLVGSDGRVHDSIRNVVLSAVSGEGLDMEIGSPFAPVTP